MEINEVEKSIERYMKIYNQIQSNIDAKQLALNDQSSKNLFANGKLTIDQMNETIQEITNIGFFVCVSNESDLSNNELLVIQSIYDKFENNKGFYTNEYLSKVFNKPNSKFIINVPNEKINIEDGEEIDYKLFISKLATDWINNQKEFENIFMKNYENNSLIMKTIVSSVQSNSIEYEIINIFNSDADLSQVNQSIINLQNKLSKVYEDLSGKKLETKVNDKESEKNEDPFDFKKILFIIIIIVGICVVSSILILIFVRPGISAGINSLTGGV